MTDTIIYKGEPNFGLVYTEALQDTRLSVSARYLYALLCTYRNRDNQRAWPGQDRLAKEAGVSTRSIRAWLTALEETGWLRKVKHAAINPDWKGNPSANLYIVYARPTGSQLPIGAEAEFRSDRKPASTEHTIEQTKEQLPEAQTPPVADLPELEYVPFGDDDFPEEDGARTVEPYRVPELKIHHDVLAACNNAKLFPARVYRLKSALTGLAKAVEVGKVLGEGVYQACLDGLNGKDKLTDPLPPIPASWIEYKMEHARENPWSVQGTVKALRSVEGLRKHCLFHLKKMGVKAPKPPLEKHEFPGAITYE